VICAHCVRCNKLGVRLEGLGVERIPRPCRDGLLTSGGRLEVHTHTHTYMQEQARVRETPRCRYTAWLPWHQNDTLPLFVYPPFGEELYHHPLGRNEVDSARCVAEPIDRSIKQTRSCLLGFGLNWQPANTFDTSEFINLLAQRPRPLTGSPRVDHPYARRASKSDLSNHDRYRAIARSLFDQVVRPIVAPSPLPA
jgi:hypothetical protein